ncbi:IclR family transcriptional regulator [Microbacterium profundi]|uniref:IclR family transcriptional regulator n=1 Tax=Microbacterium profundi TaxID=450380 RepID=UPI001F256254|nr:IclR family transcriptional regulator [Microbacterium profundi]MCE7481536.1 IclR family transcriptional regulator [Microbacterium profundi]
MASDSSARSSSAPAVVRALRILELLAEADDRMSLTHIAEELGLAKSSAHHVLSALIDRGWVERDPGSREVSLGLRAWEVGQGYDVAQTLSQRARTFMDEIRDELGETVRLAVRSGSDQVCIAKSAGQQKLVFDQRIGARLPCHATGLGKALLSGLEPDEVRQMYAEGLEQFTETTIIDVDELNENLAAAREAGFAEDHGEYILGIRCVAVPVRSRDGRTIAALSVSGPTARFDDEHIASCLEALRIGADALSARLGDETELR